MAVPAANLEQIAFRMQLHPGQARAYRQRHDEIWPELTAALKEAGISDYSIFLDEENHHLFAVLRRDVDHRMDQLPKAEVMRRWWAFMGDIMATEADGAPTITPLRPMFHLP